MAMSVRVCAIALVWVLGCSSGEETGEETPGSAEATKPSASEPVKGVPEPEVEEVDEAALLRERLDLPEGAKKAPSDAKKTSSGIRWVSLAEGEGKESPSRDDIVWLQYVSWDPTGMRRGNTIKKGKTKRLQFVKALPGWAEMLSEMVVGDRRRAWIPAKLAHPKKSKVKDPEDMRILDVELVKLKKAPPAPKDVKKAPKDANRLKSGLAWKELSPATGEGSAQLKSEVVVRYSGWTTDGKCFDFTGEEETFLTQLDKVIQGWTQGIALMSPGQKVRLWIPENLAYKGSRGKPKGMLVFDVELLEIR